MSRIADEIIREYKIKEAYKKKTRQKCKEQECRKCIYFKICTDRKENDTWKKEGKEERNTIGLKK